MTTIPNLTAASDGDVTAAKKIEIEGGKYATLTQVAKTLVVEENTPKVIPVKASFTSVTPNSGTVTDVPNGILISQPGGTSGTCGIAAAMPGSDWTLTVKFKPFVLHDVYSGYGLAERKISSGARRNFLVYTYQAGPPIQASDQTSDSGVQNTATIMSYASLFTLEWMRLKRVSGARQFWMSPDGINWTMLRTETVASNNVSDADQVIAFVYENGGSAINNAIIQYWELTTGTPTDTGLLKRTYT